MKELKSMIFFRLVCLVGHCAFVFGGTGFPFGVTISNALHILDLKRLSWRRYEFSEGDLQEVYGAVSRFVVIETT